MLNQELRTYIMENVRMRGMEVANGDYFLIDIRTLQPIDFTNLKQNTRASICEKEGLEIVLKEKGFELCTTRSNQTINDNWLFNMQMLLAMVGDFNDKLRQTK